VVRRAKWAKAPRTACRHRRRSETGARRRERGCRRAESGRVEEVAEAVSELRGQGLARVSISASHPPYAFAPPPPIAPVLPWVAVEKDVIRPSVNTQQHCLSSLVGALRCLAISKGYCGDLELKCKMTFNLKRHSNRRHRGHRWRLAFICIATMWTQATSKTISFRRPMSLTPLAFVRSALDGTSGAVTMDRRLATQHYRSASTGSTSKDSFVAGRGCMRRKLIMSQRVLLQGIKPGPCLMKSTLASTSLGDSLDEDADMLVSEKRFYCYLLRSLDPQHPLKTYIGFTTNPPQRLRQHNGELVRGARRTKRGRPWAFVAVLDGFEDKVAAMQFEWAWQHVGRSKTFRMAVGDQLAKKMKRRRGVRARLDELGILLSDCHPFNTFPLKVHFPDAQYHDLFCDLSKMNEPFTTESASQSAENPSLGLFGRSDSLWEKVVRAQTPFFKDSDAYNRFFRRGLSVKSQSSLALNAVAETNVEESGSDNGHADDSKVKVPAKFKPYPFSYHKELIVTIESLTNLGFGIARVELNVDEYAAIGSATGIENDQEKQVKWVIFVPNVIPGELVRVRIYRNYASYSDADLLEIIEPSKDRIEPRCSLASICGGCQYQHVTITSQRALKTTQVQDLFERVGGFKTQEFPTVLATLGTEEVFGYRYFSVLHLTWFLSKYAHLHVTNCLINYSNTSYLIVSANQRSKITPHYDAPLKKKGRKKQLTLGEAGASKSCEIGPIGFKEKASRRLVDVEYCHIATPAINDALVRIRDAKRKEARQGLLKKPTKGATLLLRDSDGTVETDHNVYVNTTVRDLVFRFQAGNFFQNNPYMLQTMVELVVEAATKTSPSGKAMTHLIDCYCGSGLFALGSSSSFDVCVGIEVNEKAVEEARHNAALNGIMNCDFVSASAEAIFQSEDPVRVATKEGDGKVANDDLFVRDFPRESTVVVVDPPRKGCSEEFLQQLNEFRPARVVYMSCDPATQARDAKLLVSFGYEIVSVQPFDLFPQTRHIECLAVFEKAAKSDQ
ncbi:hypothetical protein ACHAWF_016303, partial [Thalassiosira exigua]